MRFLRFILIVSLIAIAGFYFMEKNDLTTEEAIENISPIVKEKKSLIESKTAPEKQPGIPLEGDLFQWIGKDSDELVQTLGEPIRKDVSAYDYTWWVYTDQENQYIQFGVLDGDIETVYAAGSGLEIAPASIGQAYDEMKEQFSFSKEVTYNNGFSSYTFRLNEDELKMRPLVKMSDDIFLQCYFDTFTEKLSSIRVLTSDILLKHRPYEIEYRGNLPDEPLLSDEDWAEVENGMEKQIFDLTNVLRSHYGKSELAWEENVSEVAFLHSKDMAENNYFSHYSKDGNGLKERLAVEDIFYLAAGENIAAQYPDAAAAMEGWLNSEGHREALLNDDYTHLGAGVYRFYYTQNFLSRP
ncbi:hypothetical protein CIL03_04605 [Virgibacillus indicus]|uniref:CAP domain-containing protein n=1 Tax=Virgibacillus indicus TaxID=2024554 RepID=A0A265NEG9_9BACI|nr:CAP domain-containing protein [Virgibacillus indicus]OZU90432.1 hypothetical protein CIL03_04605 [Virgibacillus indicus]